MAGDLSSGASPADRDEEEEPAAAESERWRPSRDPEAPEADALDQAREVEPGPRPGWRSRDPEAPDADAWEQSQEVPLDDDAHDE